MPDIFSNKDAEASLVATVMAFPEAWPEVSHLRPEQFESSRMALIWRLLQARDGVCPPEVLSFEICKKEKASEDTVRSQIAEMSAYVHPAQEAVGLSELVAECSANRQLRSSLQMGQSLLRNPVITAQERLEQVQGQLDLITVGGGGNLNEFLEGLDEYEKELEFYQTHPGQVYGIRLGFPDLDRLIRGLAPGNLMVVASNTGEGKSLFCGSVALNVISKEQDDGRPRKVAFFGLEMSGREMANRMCNAIARVRPEDVYGKHPDPDSIERLEGAKRWLRERMTSESFIYKGPAEVFNMSGIVHTASYLVRQHGVDLIVVDYLQRIQTKMRDKRSEEIGDITSRLKVLAAQLGVPIIAVSQVSRTVSKEQHGKATLWDLAESSSVEKDADYVLVFWRPDRHIENSDVRKRWANIAIVEVAKARHREEGGKCFLRFDGNSSRLDSLDTATVSHLMERYDIDLRPKKK
jgi:replicative DNA helicase